MKVKDEEFFAPDDTVRALYARIDDLCRHADQGMLAVTPFLTPREAKYARRYLAGRLADGGACLWGGYPDAERVRVFLFPDYTNGLLPNAAGKGMAPVESLRTVGFDELAEDAADQTVALSVCGSGFQKLTHRDYMGAVLGVGLERDAIGDILSADGRNAVLFCNRHVANFLIEAMTKVGTDAVRLRLLSTDELVIPPRFMLSIQDTVASERLDCIVAALCGLSRERAQGVVREGLCELDYESVRDCDRILEPPAILSVRGYGKYRVLSFGDRNRRGRLRLYAEKFTG